MKKDKSVKIQSLIVYPTTNSEHRIPQYGAEVFHGGTISAESSRICGCREIGILVDNDDIQWSAVIHRPSAALLLLHVGSEHFRAMMWEISLMGYRHITAWTIHSALAFTCSVRSCGTMVRNVCCILLWYWKVPQRGGMREAKHRSLGVCPQDCRKNINTIFRNVGGRLYNEPFPLMTSYPTVCIAKIVW